jgi:uncharacterized protein
VNAVRLVWLAFATILAALFVVGPASALDVPKLEGRVNDRADMLSADAEARIERTLEAHEKATGEQFAVLTIESLEGDDLKGFSIRTVEAWKLGREKEDDGLLLLVVKKERMINIEVGHGLEGTITDALSSRIIRGVIEPAFKAGEFAAGIEGALIELTRREGASQPEPLPPPSAPQKRGPSPLTLIVLLLIFGPFLLRLFGVGGGVGGFGRRGRFGGWYGGSWGGFGGGGFSSGGSGGGGFGGGGGFSGGGGSFGGGGASGRW